MGMMTTPRGKTPSGVDQAAGRECRWPKCMGALGGKLACRATETGTGRWCVGAGSGVWEGCWTWGGRVYLCVLLRVRLGGWVGECTGQLSVKSGGPWALYLGSYSLNPKP